MSDLEERLREAISASVAGAEPKFDVMDAVRRRHRRHLLRVTGASVIAAVTVVVAVVLLGVPHGARPHSSPAATPAKSHAAKQAVAVFPGGGRLLFADRHGLKWLYPDGRTVRIARGFTGAAVAAGRLVAWNQTGAYVMNLDGSRRQLVLPFRPGQPNRVIGVSGLSPDGSRLAYYVGTDPVVTGDKLWVADLATGRRVELGRFSSGQWRDNTTILATSLDGKAVLLVNAETGSRSVYLTPLSDPLLIHAYERARPGAGRPAVWSAGGFSGSGSSAAFAVELGAAGPFMGGRPAEVVMLGGGRVVTYAPATPQQFEFGWGPDGMFRILTGAGNNPASWNTYIGTLRSDRLSQPIGYGSDGAAFSPAGNVIALQDSNQVTFLPTPRPACQRTARCLNFGLKYLTNEGTLLAWTR